MSIAGIASSLFSQLANLQPNQPTKIQTEFQQLAQDLQSGNLSQAQADFATLQQTFPGAQPGSTSPVAQAFSALGKDLQAGNLSAAQQDFSTVQQDVQQAAQAHHHHHHHGGSSSASAQQNSITQLFSTLGQDLQGGNLTGAQQAYAALQQDLPFLASSSSSGGVNLSA